MEESKSSALPLGYAPSAAADHSGFAAFAPLGWARLRRLGGLLQQLAVHEVAVAIEQRVRGRIEGQVDDLADIDGVRAGRDLGHQPAVERHRAARSEERRG